MRNSLSRQRVKPPSKPSGRPLATPAMPLAKLEREEADRVISRSVAEDGLRPELALKR